MPVAIVNGCSVWRGLSSPVVDAMAVDMVIEREVIYKVAE